MQARAGAGRTLLRLSRTEAMVAERQVGGSRGGSSRIWPVLEAKPRAPGCAADTGVRAGVLRIIQLSHLLLPPMSHASALQAFLLGPGMFLVAGRGRCS